MNDLSIRGAIGPLFMMNAYAWSSFVTFVSVFTVGVGVLLHRPEGEVNQRFALFAASIAIWSSGRVLYLTASQYEAALFWARFTIAGTLFIPTLFFHFVSTFLKIRVTKTLILSYAASLFFFIANFSPWMVKGVSIKYQGSYFIDPGFLYPLLLVHFAVHLLIGFHLLRSRYRRASGLEKNQIRFVLGSTLIGFTGGMTNFLADFGWDRYSVSAYATYLVSIFSFTLTYAIVRYRLLDVEIVVQRSLIYLVTLLATGVPFFFLMEFFETVLPPRAARVGAFFLLIAILLVFSNLKPLTQQWVEQSLFRERYRHYQSIHEFSRSIVRFLHLEDLTERLFNVLMNTLRPRSISIFLCDGKGNFHLHRSFGLDEGAADVLLPSHHPLLAQLRREKKILLRDEMERGEADRGVLRQMQDLQGDLLLPFIFEDRLVGFCSLGPKWGGKIYSASELYMLQTLSDNVSVAIENARLFREVGRARQQFGAINQAINLSPDVDRIFELLLHEFEKVAHFDWASIAIYKGEGEVYFYRVKGRQDAPLPENYTWPLTDLSILSRLTLKHEPILQADLFGPGVAEGERQLAKTGVRSYLILPLRARGKLIGALSLWGASPIEKPAQTLDFVVPLANQLAPFLEVARLFEEMKKTNEALHQKSLELEEAHRAQARFFSFMTHELKTPLNSIIGYLSLIVSGTYGPVSSKQALPLHRIKENSDLLSRMINDFLDLARLGSGRVSVQLGEVDLPEFLRGILAPLEPLISKKGLDIRLGLEDPGPFYTDHSKLRQILQNILSNAIKFTDRGFIGVTMRFIPERDGVLFEITDSGKGISEEDLPHIFEVFWEGRPAESFGETKGSGLGLAIAKKAVEVLGGQIDASSRLGRGSTFTIFLPRRYPQDQVETA